MTPRAAIAQPLFELQHDWTVTIGDELYGLREYAMQPGELRQTVLWWAGEQQAIQRPLFQVLLPVLAGVTLVVGVGWFLLQRRSRGSRVIENEPE